MSRLIAEGQRVIPNVDSSVAIEAASQAKAVGRRRMDHGIPLHG